MPATIPLDLLRWDLEEIVTALDEGRISSISLTKECLRRIAADNLAGRGLRAVAQLVPEEQHWMPQDRARLSRLHGVPILIKDAIATDPEFHLDTAGGTKALVTSRPKRNAPLVDRLVAAGMIVLGKASMSILNGWFHHLVGGWSPLIGQVRSAYGPQHKVWGSSTGSAVAVSAGMCPVAIGVDSNGSIVRDSFALHASIGPLTLQTAPADRAGILGFRPTHGLISAEGIIPINHDFDTPGPMGKTAFDIAALLDVLVDEPTSFVNDLLQDNTSATKTKPLAIGISDITKFPTIDSEGIDLFNQAAGMLGDTVVKETGIQIDGLLEIDQDEERAVCQLYKIHQRDDWARYLEGCEGEIKTLGDLVDWHDAHPAESFHPNCPGQQFLREGLDYDGVRDAEKIEPALVAAKRVTTALKHVFDDRNLDAIMFPFENASHLSSASGFPAVSVPFGLRANGRPFGVVFISPSHQDAKLLSVIRHCEMVFPPRPIPPGWSDVEANVSTEL